MPSGSPFRAPTLPTRRFGLLSTYPPKLCGLATFAAALESGLQLGGHRVDIVRIDDGRDGDVVQRPVAAELVNGVPASIRKAAMTLSRCDVAIIQHEYGIYGGADGDEVLDLLEALAVPTIVVLHTVPLHPTTRQKSILEAIGRLADRLVVMTETGKDRLTANYRVDLTKVQVIPHGASVPTHETQSSAELAFEAEFETDLIADAAADRPGLLTWGLLGPGKGIEHAIDALTLLRDRRPRLRYTVAGVTHPKVFAQFGDVYRQSLIQKCWAGGIANSVVFDDTYRGVARLTRFVESATAVVLPYDSRDQVTSGVLVDAIAAGRPVIATGFPHAVELLSSGAGIIVPHEDPVALADAMLAITSDPELLASMTAEARRIAPSLSWEAVARTYAHLSEDIIALAEQIAI